jgi:Tfp pilus assembly protein PilO
MNRFKFLNSIPIVIAICFLLFLVLGGGLILPKYKGLKDLQASVAEKETELQYKQQYFSNLADVKTKLDKYEEELSKIDSALPFGPSLPSLFNFIQGAGSQSGIVLKGISPFTSTSQKESKVKKTEFSLEVSGDYASFKSFISALEKSARLIEIENISFSLPKEGGDIFTFNIKIAVSNY